MSDEPCESLPCSFSTGKCDLSGVELTLSADLDLLSETPAKSHQASKEQVLAFVASWKAGDAARREELKDSPLVHHWAKLDADRKADGYAVYNAKRRLFYCASVLLNEDRIATQYVTGLCEAEKKERRKMRDRERKAVARATMTPEQKAEESAKRAARRAKKKMTQPTT